jgi:ubiquinone biosynthesis accessory factor UbiJ
MDAMLSTAALAAAEQIINKALAYDPGTRLALARLEPQVLAVALSAPELTLYVAPTKEGIRLMGHWEGDVATRVHGSLPALLMRLRY